jgi:hypothetical protein
MKYITIALLCILFLSACNKFLDVTPKGIIIPTTTTQYEDILNSVTLTLSFCSELIYITDDDYNYTDVTSMSTSDRAYLWGSYIDMNDQVNPVVWSSLYNTIYYTNIIIHNGVMLSTGGTIDQKQQILGEALVMRSNFYLDLLTVFAKAYNPQTAASDPGLPFMTSINMGDKVPPRLSVQAMLDTMTNNIIQAIDYLPATNINKFRVTKYAAYGLLSKIYLYKADYADAQKYAEMALTAPNYSLLDYNKYPYDVTNVVSTLPMFASNPEMLWMRDNNGEGIYEKTNYSDDLISYFDTVHDLRFINFAFNYSTSSTPLFSYKLPAGEEQNFGITFPEMNLTRAEVYARNGDIKNAMAIVNTLRKCRIDADFYTDLTAATPDAALTIVLAERRRELAFGGTRWFDMKRLDQGGRMGVVTRVNKALDATATAPAKPAIQIASLPPHSPNYTFQIPLKVQEFNPNMVKN